MTLFLNSYRSTEQIQLLLKELLKLHTEDKISLLILLYLMRKV
jgi:hypothetical protein